MQTESPSFALKCHQSATQAIDICAPLHFALGNAGTKLRSMLELIENSAPPESHVSPCDYDVLIADAAYLDTLGKAMLVLREDMR
jgi:hypothetical protein